MNPNNALVFNNTFDRLLENQIDELDVWIWRANNLSIVEPLPEVVLRKTDTRGNQAKPLPVIVLSSDSEDEVELIAKENRKQKKRKSLTQKSSLEEKNSSMRMSDRLDAETEKYYRMISTYKSRLMDYGVDDDTGSNNGKRRRDYASLSKKEDKIMSAVKRERRSLGYELVDAPTVPMDDNGMPKLPMDLGEIIIYSFGEIVHDRPNYHCRDLLYPVGFRAARIYKSFTHPDQEVKYFCTVKDGGDDPLFEIIAEDAPQVTFCDLSAPAVWTKVENGSQVTCRINTRVR